MINPIDPKLESIDGDSYQLNEDYAVRVGYWMRQVDFVIPAHTRTDIASVPWYMRWLYDRASLGLLAPIVHDYLCDNQGKITHVNGRKIQLSWFQVHIYFLILMQIDGINDRRSFLSFLAVLIGGPRWEIDPTWTQSDIPD